MGKIFCQLYNNQYFVLYYLTKLIFMKLKMFFTSLLAILFIGVSYSQDSTSTNKAWKQGDFFVGVNSNLLEVSANSIGLSPSIGYAISNQDMLWVSLWYAKNPRVSTFKGGWQRTVYHSLFIGVSGAVYGEGSQWNKSIGFEIGVVKPLWTWLVVQPKIGFVEDWNDTVSQFHFSTGVTFAVKLTKKT